MESTVIGYLAIGVVVSVLLGILPAVDIIRRWFGGVEPRTIAPQPLSVKAADEFQNKADCLRLHNSLERKLEQIGLRIEAAVDKLGSEAEKRASNLHDRIDPISRELAAVSGRLDDHLNDHRVGKV